MAQNETEDTQLTTPLRCTIRNTRPPPLGLELSVIHPPFSTIMFLVLLSDFNREEEQRNPLGAGGYISATSSMHPDEEVARVAGDLARHGTNFPYWGGATITSTRMRARCARDQDGNGLRPSVSTDGSGGWDGYVSVTSSHNGGSHLQHGATP